MRETPYARARRAACGAESDGAGMGIGLRLPAKPVTLPRMNDFRADLHIHSRFSRATSTRLAIPHLAAWAMIKGLAVVGTGDFTHPAWREELERDLVPDEASGLYRPRKPPTDADVAAEIPGFGRPGGATEAPLFLLQTEISSIYKRGGVVRKVHNLVFMPDLDSVDALNRKLAAVGNLASDGRPILGLDSERLLEMVLETNERGVLIPAHVWTPWFALFGSKSGFDALEDCFGALSSHIFALETGLSSDPGMNRLWSRLDRYVLISNSDAHSGENLGREANLFGGTPSYDGIFSALRRAAGIPRGQANGADKPNETDKGACVYRGTLEFFPEEGKYHLDGHRACNVALDPKESKQLGDICPVCGKPLTVGVLHRVLDLADRDEPAYAPDEARFASLIPLPELLGELLGVGAKSRKVRLRQAELTSRFGSELDILHTVSEADLRAHWDALGEAVARMRAGRVFRQAGYDGEYGVVRVFDPRERADFAVGRIHAGSLLNPALPLSPTLAVPGSGLPIPTRTAHGPQTGQAGQAGKSGRGRPPKQAGPSLWDAVPAPHDAAARQAADPETPPSTGSDAAASGDPVFAYSADQQRAIDAGPHPVLVVAGPGAGKTRTLVGRAARLLTAPDPLHRVAAEQILAVTFTRRAAGELRERLAQNLTQKLAPKLARTPGDSPLVDIPRADTLHAIALSQWTSAEPEAAKPEMEPETQPGLTSGADAGTDGTNSENMRQPGNASLPAVLSEEAARAVFAKANPDRPAAELRAAWNRLSLARERLEDLHAVPEFPDLPDMAARYAACKKAAHLADYTDLLEHWLKALTATRAPSPWTEILVDEIQDLSPLQVAVIRALLPPSGRGFFGIGDPDQAVYGFRGAHPDVRAALTAAWPDLETVTLRESHRSASGILDSASALLGAASACGRLLPTRKESAVLHEFAAPDATREAAWVAEQITRLLGATSHTLLDARAGRNAAARMPDAALSSPCSPGDLAVLVRMKSLIPPLHAALERRGIPCSVPENAPFWEEPRVGLILSLAGRRFGRPWGAGPEQELAAVSPDALPDSLWRQGPAALLAHLENTPPFDPLFRESAAFAALVRAYREQGSWEALLEWTSLRQELDLVRAEAEQVQIMTLHAAKGLEFRAVFLPALEEGLLPFFGPEALAKMKETDRPAPAHENAAEERRLFYVGLTRAKEAVFLSHAARRTLYGRELRLPASRFLADVERFFRHSRLIRHTRTTARQMSLF